MHDKKYGSNKKQPIAESGYESYSTCNIHRQWKQNFWMQISKKPVFTLKKKIKFQNAYLEENREEPSSYILVGHTADAVRANLRSLIYQNEFHITKTGTSD